MILKNLLQSLRLNNRNLLPVDMHTTDYPYLDIYYDNANELDFKYLGVDYATLPTVSDLLTDLDMLVKATIKTNAYKYNKIYEVNNVEYNPIWNVDGTEIEEHEIGKRKQTNAYGEDSVTSTNSEVPDDMTTEKEVYKNVSDREARNDTIENDATKDTITKTRQGNIGVTMTQQLIEAERRIADFDLTHVILMDIINAITYPTFEEV